MDHNEKDETDDSMLDNSEEEEKNIWLRQDTAAMKTKQLLKEREVKLINSSKLISDAAAHLIQAERDMPKDEPEPVASQVDEQNNVNKVVATERQLDLPTHSNSQAIFSSSTSCNAIENPDRVDSLQLSTGRREYNAVHLIREQTGVILKKAVIRNITSPAIELDDL